MQKKTAQAQTMKTPGSGHGEKVPSLVHVLGSPRFYQSISPSSQRQSPKSAAQPFVRPVQSTRDVRKSPVALAQLPILLIDDDRSFGAILKRSAAKAGLNITVCHDLDGLATQMNSFFAVAIVDYDLGSVTGFEIVKYLENQAWNTPFVFISQSDLPRHERQTHNERNFIHKALGPGAIINAVFEAHEAGLAQRDPQAFPRTNW